ncbi:MAG TPA: sugar phosphate isomerase/epimerase [Gemmatimonadales bacterium]
MRRREFVATTAGATLALSGLPPLLRNARDPEPAGPIRFGYAAITWQGNDLQAIDDIAALGFRGIQLRASAAERWGANPQELRDLLGARALTFVALSSGLVRLDPAVEAEDLALHLRNARFVRDAGGLYLQVVDQRPTGRVPTPDDFRRMGRLLTELGRRTADLGVPLGYHNHMGNLGQSADEVARVLDAADPRFLKLELDIAHYGQAGGDPAEAVRRYAERLLFLHIKDVESPVPGGPPNSYRFVELGRGKVDLRAVFAMLGQVRFKGWAIVELDRSDTPKESGGISRRYLTETLGLEV